MAWRSSMKSNVVWCARRALSQKRPDYHRHILLRDIPVLFRRIVVKITIAMGFFKQTDAFSSPSMFKNYYVGITLKHWDWD
jgi:hypothetical protein